SMPIEKTAGKIASPANNATTTFIITTTKAELTKFSSFETYELYVTRLLNPTLNRKKDCPKAIKMDVACKLEKTKDKKSDTPSIALSKTNEGGRTTSNNISRAGMRNLDAFSIPCLIPRETTSTVINRKAI